MARLTHLALNPTGHGRVVTLPTANQRVQNGFSPGQTCEQLSPS